MSRRPNLGPKESAVLVAGARLALVEHFTGTRSQEAPPEAALAAKAGAFVSIYVDGNLRGCLGSIRGKETLWDTVRDMVVAAATRDPRFPALTAEEAANATLEISVLGALEPTKPQEVEIGRDGLYVAEGDRTGLLLPQVAIDRGWDTVAFLANVCRKAGLPPDAWKGPRIRLYRFSAQVIRDDARA